MVFYSTILFHDDFAGFTTFPNPYNVGLPGSNEWGICLSLHISSSQHVNITPPTSRMPIRSTVQCPILLMLVSHCGEYMSNGLTNAVRHEFVMIANDRQTFVAVRCFECYAGLTSGECMANGLTNAIRHQFAMIAK